MAKRTSIWTEFFLFMKENKVYWMGPIVAALLLLAVLLALSGSALAPFLYPFF